MVKSGTLAVAACLVTLGGVPALAGAADADKRVFINGTITKQEAGVGPRASDVAFARAAIASKRTELKLGRHTGLRLADTVALAGLKRGTKLRQLRFVQTVGGLRVLWSQLNIGVNRGAVRGISGTSVEVPSGKLFGARRIAPQAAVDIARRAIDGDEDALPAQQIAYAGRPDKPKAARRAYVVQVAPAGKTSGDTGQTFCVVVDAENGRVLDVWEGQALRPDTARKATTRAAGETVVIQLVDGHNTTATITPDYKDIVAGNPFDFGQHSGFTSRFFGTNFTSEAAKAEASVRPIAQYWCTTRGYCGRSLSAPMKRFFVTANSARGGVYSPQDERIYLGADRTNDYVMAHEMGHLLDITLAGEGNVDFQAREVREAVGEMYAFEYVRERFIPGEGTLANKMASPPAFITFQGLRYPKHMANYCRRADRDEHLNGFILAHAYWKIVKRLGHHTAGALLAHMSWRLPVWRTYGSVRVAFRQVALYFYGQNSEVYRAIEDSFDAVGVYDNTSIPGNTANSGCG